MGDHGNGLQPAGLQMAGNLHRRGPRVQDDGFVVLDQVRRCPPDSDLLSMVQRLLQAQRIILTCFQSPDGAAVRANHHPIRRQRVQVSARRNRRNGKHPYQVPHRDLAFLLDQIQDFSATLFCQPTKVLAVSHHVRSPMCGPGPKLRLGLIIYTLARPANKKENSTRTKGHDRSGIDPWLPSVSPYSTMRAERGKRNRLISFSFFLFPLDFAPTPAAGVIPCKL